MATLTVYSDSGGDGDITSGTGAWSTVRAGTGLSVDAADNDGNVYTDTAHYIRRHYYPFDTSSIGASDTIDDATLTLTHPNSAKLDTDSLSWGIVESQQASLTSLVTGDWVTNFTRLSSDKTYATITGGGANSAHDYVLNATGEGIIAKGSGFTKLACLVSVDIDNSDTATGNNYVDWYFSNEAGTTRDPKLVVNHSAAAAAEDPAIFFGANF